MLGGTVALLVLLVLGVAACGPGGGGVFPRADGGGPDPVGLVGLWRVERPGGPDAEWLRLDAGELQLWTRGTLLSGSWSAGDGLLVAEISSWQDDASPEDGDWLSAIAGYRRAGARWELLSADEDVVVATLRVDGAPDPIANATDEWTRPPEVTDRTREALTAPAPLPSGLAAPDRSDLVGRWVADAPTADDEPHVELAEDGTYSGSDGCNGASGRWAAGGGGRVLATSGPMTLIGCPGAPVPSWLASAARVGLDGGALVLLDRDGQELGRLRRG